MGWEDGQTDRLRNIGAAMQVRIVRGQWGEEVVDGAKKKPLTMSTKKLQRQTNRKAGPGVAGWFS